MRFDIPQGLDDTASRFIMAVTLRYKFDAPGESSVHGNFGGPGGFVEDHQQKCVAYAEPLIQHLHGNGIIFIRQLLPAGSMHILLSSMGVTEDFLVLSSSLLRVLEKIGGNHLSRKYLIAQCRHLMDTQKQLQITSTKGASDAASNQNFSLGSFLGECGAAGSDDFDDDDNPGGLWTPKARCVETNGFVEAEVGITYGLPQTTMRRKTARNRSWVCKYTAKIISENESKHPALFLRRHGQLLGDRHDSNSGR